jgi:hypothetical protein
MRVQVGRQRRELLQLQKAAIPTAAAESLLQRMLYKIDALCADRDRLKAVLHVQAITLPLINSRKQRPGNRE